MVTAPLLEKPNGGFRPNCIYASLYRLWAKARQPVAAEGEETEGELDATPRSKGDEGALEWS